MHYKYACDYSEPSHAPDICMWSFRTITCITNMHVIVQNHHMHQIYACDRSEPSHAPQICMWSFRTITCTTIMHVTVQNHHMHHKYACDHSDALYKNNACDCSEPSHALQICMWSFRCTIQKHMSSWTS